MTPGGLRFYNFVRAMHIYLCLLGLVLLLFFAVTGFVLNHSGWFGLDEPESRTMDAQVPVKLLEKPDELALVEYLRAQHGAAGSVILPIEIDDEKVRVSFRRPGRHFDAEITRVDGKMQITIEESNLLALMGELHSGKNAGRTWRLCIDGAAILLALAALTGLVLWLPLVRQRTWGLVSLGVGLGMVALAWVLALR